MAALLHMLFFTTILLCWSLTQKQVAAGDLTDGFTSLPLNTSHFDIQKPYDIPVNKRYSFIDGVHKMWVYNTDKPHSPTSPTKSRTELRIKGYDYSSGVWQFEGYGFIPSGTSGVCVMQVFGVSLHGSTLMLRTYYGNLSYYRAPVLIHGIYDRWFRLNVIHDVDASKLYVYIDAVLAYETNDKGRDSHYFKCGVYSQNDASNYMESRWKDIKVLKKD